MTTPTNQKAAVPTIDAKTRLGGVHYTVANLDRQIDFYTNVLGFKLHWRDADAAGLGAGSVDLLRFTRNADALPSRGTTGLYHTAFLFPNRWELANLLRRIAETRTPIQGMTNHGTHWAIYLPDLEGNGIELAWDFPQEVWPRTAQEMMSGNRGLHPNEVFSHLEDNTGWQGIAPETKVGHVHLHVSHIPETREFYHDILGFEIPFDFNGFSHPMAGTALFFAAGGYHHHIGTNVWAGVGAPPPPTNATGLRHYQIIVPTSDELNRLVSQLEAARIATEDAADGIIVRDPAQNGILITTG